jgi:hypothetical protein
MKQDLMEHRILEMKFGKPLLFSRYIGPLTAQVHDGENVLAEMGRNYSSMAKRGQNFVVRTYAPFDPAKHYRPMLTETFHGKVEAAHAKMERLAIKQYLERIGE